MRTQVLFLGLMTSLFATVDAVAAENLKSGLQPGEAVPSFDVLNVINVEKPDLAGKKYDVVIEQYRADPVVLIFARELNDPLAALVKKLDAEVGKHKDKKLHALVVMLSSEDGFAKKVKDFAEKHGTKNVSFAVMDNVAGPPAFRTPIAKQAEVTVALYTSRKGKTNHAFEKGKLNEQGIDKVIADVPKVLPK